MNITDSFSQALRSVITFLPKFAAFLVILVIGWLVAKGLRKLVTLLLDRVNFEQVVERGGIQRALARSKYDASGIVAAIVYYAVLLIALQLAFGVFGPNPISSLLTGVLAWLPSAFVAIAIIVVAAAIAGAVRDIVGSALSGLSYGAVLARSAQVFLIGLGVIAALNQIGVATTVTTPVLITVLATLGGVLVVGVGGGMIRPMQQRWERWLGRAEQEAPRAKSQAQAHRHVREDVTRARTEPIRTAEQETRASEPPHS